MKVIDHGEWVSYFPEEMPPNVPINTVFAKREDGTDWYKYAHSDENFDKNSIKMTCMLQHDHWFVMAANRDVRMLFPAGMMVIEVTGSNVKNPQEHFGRREYFPDTNEFGDDQEFKCLQLNSQQE